MLDFVYGQSILGLILLTIFIVVLYAISSYAFLELKSYSIIKAIFLLLSLAVIPYETVFFRPNNNYEIYLLPFNFLIESRVQPELYRSFFMNALLFVPLGLSMPYVLSKKPYKRNIFITIVFSALLSAGIEFLQYYYHLGRCETDDVIANTLGAAVGTLSYWLYMHILKNQEKGSLMKKINNNQKLLLDLCAKSLFDKDIIIPDEFDYKELIEEAKKQTVFPVAYSLIKDKCDDVDSKIFSQIIAKNIRVEYAHNEIHRILSDNNIPYVILKGVASASYYKEPMLRMMGDVDVLVRPDDIAKADKLLKSIGFVTSDDIDGDDMHIGYKRKDGISCELHRRINGVPNNDIGNIINEYIADIFEKSQKLKTSNGSCLIPSNFHHGIILLLHTASHLTSEGVGLRHLCDWAVFVNSFSNDEFVILFEKPLKEMGLWRFAQLLTLCCVKHLGCDPKEWAGQYDNKLIDSIFFDILNSGNFGLKDENRYNQIKYISNRQVGTVDKKNSILQLFYSINAKTKKELDFVNKSKFLLPIGWIVIVCKYFYMVLIGKRNLDNISIIKGANERKNIYSEFHLFE